MQMTGGQAQVIESLNVPSGQTKPPSQIAAPAGLGDGLADRGSFCCGERLIVRNLSCFFIFIFIFFCFGDGRGGDVLNKEREAFRTHLIPLIR